MIVLDTNVVSELMRPSPSPAVEAWMTEQDTTSLFFTATGEAELRYGVALMAAGRRHDELASTVEAMLREDFAERILPFDSAAARAYATIASTRRSSGYPLAQSDGQIAAIARSRHMAVATRNTRDFKDTGVNLINPWSWSNA
ncbi:MAG: type II toxin-antitoxin system VapC family toxin [Acidimicrobiaceae bacterium]|nr:type II toxin-antitoxin system VapC family toxin [Acidimicrobiaceae bacterium]